MVNNRIFWEGVIGPDLGASNEASVSNEVVITFRVSVSGELHRVTNQASALTDTNGDNDFSDETTPLPYRRRTRPSGSRSRQRLSSLQSASPSPLFSCWRSVRSGWSAGVTAAAHSVKRGVF